MEKHVPREWADPDYQRPTTAQTRYYRLQARDARGNFALDLITGRPMTWAFSGDLIAGTGWLDTLAADRRVMVSMGPFHLQAEDSTSVTFATIATKSTSSLVTVVDLRKQARAPRNAMRGGALSCTTPIANDPEGIREMAIHLFNLLPIQALRFRLRYDAGYPAYKAVAPTIRGAGMGVQCIPWRSR